MLRFGVGLRSSSVLGPKLGRELFFLRCGEGVARLLVLVLRLMALDARRTVLGADAGC